MILEGIALEKPTSTSTSPEIAFPSICCESTALLQSSQKTGFWAKTDCIVLEMDRKVIQEICCNHFLKNPQDETRRWIVEQYIQQMQRDLHLTSSQLRNCPFFSSWSEHDLGALVVSAKARVAFSTDEVLVANSLISEVIVICRGSCMVSGEDHRYELGAGDSFGEDFAMFEDRCPFSLRAAMLWSSGRWATMLWLVR